MIDVCTLRLWRRCRVIKDQWSCDEATIDEVAVSGGRIVLLEGRCIYRR